MEKKTSMGHREKDTCVNKQVFTNARYHPRRVEILGTRNYSWKNPLHMLKLNQNALLHIYIEMCLYEKQTLSSKHCQETMLMNIVLFLCGQGFDYPIKKHASYSTECVAQIGLLETLKNCKLSEEIM